MTIISCFKRSIFNCANALINALNPRKLIQGLMRFGDNIHPLRPKKNKLLECTAVYAPIAQLDRATAF